MKDRIDIDKFFNQQLADIDATTQSQDWDAMAKLLDQDKALPVLPIPVKKFNSLTTLKIIIMTSILLTTLITIYSGFFNSTEHVSPAISNLIPIENPVIALDSNESATISEIPTSSLQKGKSTSAFITTKSATEPFIERTTAITKGGLKPELDTEPPVDSIRIKDGFELLRRTYIKKEWVEPTYEYVYKEHVGDIDKGWIGIHYNQEASRSGDTTVTHGFNVQFMSGNILKSSPLAIYGGLDWGMQFRGRSEKTDVILNTANDDVGYTLLSSLSHDFLLRGHMEYPKHRIVPYVTAFAGPRVYFTGQKVAMYKTPMDTDGSTRENVSAPASLMYGYGIGGKIRITDVMSFDARYEMTFGQDEQVVDLDKSYLSGTNYVLNHRKQQGNFGQIKIGIVFDVSEREKTKELVNEGYYREVEETYFINPNDLEKVIMPCNCPCDDDESDSWNRVEAGEEDESGAVDEIKTWQEHLLQGIMDGIDSGGADGGSRNSTPTIKQPVIRH